jgi:hypothetical protein
VETLDLAARVALIVVFGAATAGKLSGRRAFVNFVDSLRQLGFVPVPGAVAVAIVSAELASAILMLAGPVLPGVVIGALLLLAFSAGIALALVRETDAKCQCFGATGQKLGATHLYRNGLLIVIAAVAVAGQVTATAAAFAAPGWAYAVAGLLLGGLLTRWDDLTFIFSAPQPRREHSL